jgi:hypothetical protein
MRDVRAIEYGDPMISARYQQKSVGNSSQEIFLISELLINKCTNSRLTKIPSIKNDIININVKYDLKSTKYFKKYVKYGNILLLQKIFLMLSSSEKRTYF